MAKNSHIEWTDATWNVARGCSKVFIKQLGTHLAKEMSLKDRHGRDWNEWPERLKIREFPA